MFLSLKQVRPFFSLRASKLRRHLVSSFTVFTGKEVTVQCLVSTQAKYNHVLHAIPKVYIPFRAEF